MDDRRARNGVERIDSEQSVKERRQRGSRSSVPPDPRNYADAVTIYSKLTAANSLFPGPHYEALAGYLQQPYEVHAPKTPAKDVRDSANRADPCVSLYDLNPKARSIAHLKSIEEFDAQATHLLDQSDFGQLLFIRGNASPEWLLAIGTKYRVDPMFFHRHLNFQNGSVKYFEYPSLLSTASTMARLRITTIGDTMVDSGDGSERQKLIEKMREQSERLLSAHHEKFQANHEDLKMGDSIVRDCSIFDTRHFTLEQDVSIWASKTDKTWIVIIWLDIGHDLSEGPASRLASPSHVANQQWLTRCLPVIQHKSNAVFKPRSYKRLAETSTSRSSATSSCQNASLLHLDYGRDLDRHAAASDAFYCLNEIFRFAAFSESQFLNMLHSKIAEELSQRSILENKSLTLSNMFYYQRALERHIQRIEENIESIKTDSPAIWPKLNLEGGQQDLTDVTSEALLRDYRDLLKRMEVLYERCNKGIQVMMSAASIRESQKAIIQAEEVSKLTRLAFIFIPLSFLTSFFGMNFEQLGTGTLPIWIWFAPALPLVLTALFFMRFNLRGQMWRLARWTMRTLSGTAKSSKEDEKESSV